MVARCDWGMQAQVSMVVRCYWGMSVAKRIGMVGSRWRWVADGGAVLLGNFQIGRCLAMVGSRLGSFASGGAVFLGHAIADC